jgi:hypothetical protein
MIIDTPVSTTSSIPCLLTQGVRTVVRYYNHSNSLTFPSKRLELAEAQALSAHGLQIAVTFQQRQNQAADFSEAKGLAAGNRAYRYAQDDIGQSAGSAIYFSVDFDATVSETNNAIVPFFNGVKQAFQAQSGGAPEYRVGAYSSGAVCKTLAAAGLIELTWLAMSQGFRGTREARAAGQFHLAQLPGEQKLCGLDCDFNEANAAQPDFGTFTLDHGLPVPPVVAPRFKVIARSGLRMREGAGAQFDQNGSLRPGQVVFVPKIEDGWASIDIEGDGLLDGFASAAFLEAVQ